MDQGSTGKRSAVDNFAPTVTKFCVMWEGRALPHHTKFGNCRCEMVGRRMIFIWSLIHGSSWSGLIKAWTMCCPESFQSQTRLTVVYIQSTWTKNITEHLPVYIFLFSYFQHGFTPIQSIYGRKTQITQLKWRESAHDCGILGHLTMKMASYKYKRSSWLMKYCLTTVWSLSWESPHH